jgi:oxygen-independent coproporphyrinogen-3 oxidase
MWKPVLQKAVTGRSKRFRMLPANPPWPDHLTSPGLYLHVPFCKSLCPYCPYNRVKYNSALFTIYTSAVKQEIDLYASRMQNQAFSSLYIGGGTPTLNLSGLLSIIEYLKNRIGDVKGICVELHPGHMDVECLSALQDAGVSKVSIGVESTSDKYLRRIQRSHDRETAIAAVERVLRMGFESINVDLMFALPGQTLAEWQIDVKTIVGLGVDQLSTYPLFTFPHAENENGKKGALRKTIRPPHHTIKSMLTFSDKYCELQGLKRCAVWSWLKPCKSKFSSVTRHHYIGFGPGAASFTGSGFHVNTFDVKSYASKLPRERPIAAAMPVDLRLEKTYWLYWRIYELKISNRDFQKLFGAGETLEKNFGNLLRVLVLMKLLEKQDDGYRVTKTGAYWIHRLQNAYSLNYINRLWGACRREAWPEEIIL